MNRVLKALEETDQLSQRSHLHGVRVASHRRKLPRARPPIRTRAEILDALQAQNRLPLDERKEVMRQVHNNDVHTWLTRHSMKVVPRTELSRKRKALLQGCFQLIDVDGNGSVEYEELGLAMKSLGFGDADIKEAFGSGDSDANGKLDFEEFAKMFTVAWAHREARVAFNDGFARDMHDVMEASRRMPAMAPTRPEGDDDEAVDGQAPTTAVEAAAPAPQAAPAAPDGEEERVTTAFPFALVANGHRITKLIDECNPIVRDLRLPKVEIYVPQPRVRPDASADDAAPPAGRRDSTRRRSSATRLPGINSHRQQGNQAGGEGALEAMAYTSQEASGFSDSIDRQPRRARRASVMESVTVRRRASTNQVSG